MTNLIINPLTIPKRNQFLKYKNEDVKDNKEVCDEEESSLPRDNVNYDKAGSLLVIHRIMMTPNIQKNSPSASKVETPKIQRKWARLFMKIKSSPKIKKSCIFVWKIILFHATIFILCHTLHKYIFLNSVHSCQA